MDADLCRIFPLLGHSCRRGLMQWLMWSWASKSFDSPHLELDGQDGQDFAWEKTDFGPPARNERKSPKHQLWPHQHNREKWRRWSENRCLGHFSSFWGHFIPIVLVRSKSISFPISGLQPEILVPTLCRADLGWIFYFGPANFRKIAGEFLSEFWWRILIANFSALFFQGFRPPQKFTPKIHVQNCRHSSPISLSWTQNLFTAIFCLRGRPRNSTTTECSQFGRVLQRLIRNMFKILMCIEGIRHFGYLTIVNSKHFPLIVCIARCTCKEHCGFTRMQILFGNRADFITVSESTVSALTEFRGDKSVSSSQPTIFLC